MGKSKDLATGASYVDTSGDTMTGNLGVNGYIDLNTSGNRAKLGYDSNNVYIGTTSSTGALYFKNNIGSTDAPHSSGDTKMIISDDAVSKPNNPWFDVRGTGNSWTSLSANENILNIFSTNLNQVTGGGFNSSNSTYTAPVAGRYCFLYSTYTKGGAAGAAGTYIYPRLYKNGSSFHPRSNILHYNANENYDTGTENTILVDLAANDTIQAGLWSNTTTNQYYAAAFQLQMFFIG